MCKTARFIGGLALGAAGMYILDPQRGRTRRTRLRDQAVGLAHDIKREAGKAARYRAGALTGVVAEAKKLFRNPAAPDAQVVSRVRSVLGHLCTHPHALTVDCKKGEVTIRGPILACEAPGVLQAVATTPGVFGLHDELESHDTPEGVPSLQGGNPERISRNTAQKVSLALAAAGAAVARRKLMQRQQS